jgi:predicted transcriptional regulator
MNDFAEVLYHWQKDQNKTQIAASLGISRPTVRKYLKIAQSAALTKESGDKAEGSALESGNLKMDSQQDQRTRSR